MKTKKSTKKLILNKSTIINLHNQELQDVKGGTKLTITNCLTCTACPSGYDTGCISYCGSSGDLT
jgi:hypothetical protein